MTECFNVLITSLSKKVPLIKAVYKGCQKLPCRAKVYGGDVNSNCTGRYFVDHFWLMPKLENLDICDLIDYCQKNRIKIIIPTRDAELFYFASHKAKLLDYGIYVMVSDSEAVHKCLDKLLFYKTMSQAGFPVIHTVEDINIIKTENVVIKERFGAGANNIRLNITKKEAVGYSKQMIHPIYQPFIKGKEYSIDLYLTCLSKVKGVIARSRNMVNNGESQITTSVKFTELETLMASVAEFLKLSGHVLFQVIHDEANNSFNIVECNPRFGGASSLSVTMGLDSFYWFALEALGEDLQTVDFARSEVEKRQIRYSEDLIIDDTCV